MARSSDQDFSLPLLDVLTDDDPDRELDVPGRGGSPSQRLMASIRRDLEDLLNSRQRCLSWPKELTELDDSILDYGVPDVTGANLGSSQDRRRFFESITNLIRKHDPRFQSVKVIPQESTDPTDRTLRFRIEAVLKPALHSEETAFDFLLEPVSRTIQGQK